MNIVNINKTIEAIRHQRDIGIFFDMGTFFDSNHSCGTSACIGGFAAILANGGTMRVGRDYESEGREYLGLDPETAGNLFYPGATEYGYEASADDAIKVLEHLKATGEADWTIVNVDPQKHWDDAQEYRNNPPVSA